MTGGISFHVVRNHCTFQHFAGRFDSDLGQTRLFRYGLATAGYSPASKCGAGAEYHARLTSFPHTRGNLRSSFATQVSSGAVTQPTQGSGSDTIQHEIVRIKAEDVIPSAEEDGRPRAQPFDGRDRRDKRRGLRAQETS